MDDMRSRYGLIVSMLEQGTSDADILDLMGIDAEQWAAIQADPVFEAAVEQAQRGGLGGPMTPEQVMERATGLTGEAFESLEHVINDPRAGATARLKAAEMVFGWRQELMKKKAEADARISYNLVIDARAVKRMENMMEMLAGEEGRAWLQEVSQIMPNSTA